MGHSEGFDGTRSVVAACGIAAVLIWAASIWFGVRNDTLSIFELVFSAVLTAGGAALVFLAWVFSKRERRTWYAVRYIGVLSVLISAALLAASAFFSDLGNPIWPIISAIAFAIPIVLLNPVSIRNDFQIWN